MSDDQKSNPLDSLTRRPLRPKTKSTANPAEDAPAKPVKRVTLPSLEEADASMAYATHGPSTSPKVQPKAQAQPQVKAQAQSDDPAPVQSIDTPAPAATPTDAASDDAAESDADADTMPGEKELSSGFILGISIVIIVLVFGLIVARLNGRVSRLEQRLQMITPFEEPENP